MLSGLLHNRKLCTGLLKSDKSSPSPTPFGDRNLTSGKSNTIRAANTSNWGGTFSKSSICDTARDTQTGKQSRIQNHAERCHHRIRQTSRLQKMQMFFNVDCSELLRNPPTKIESLELTNKSRSRLFVWKM